MGVKGTDIRELRRRLKLDRLAFARLIGYTGTDRNDVMRVRKFENGVSQIPLYIARQLWLLGTHVRRTNELPRYPAWPGYEFEHTPDPDHVEDVA